MNEWIHVTKELPPKDRKFLYLYAFGIAFGQWGQMYAIKNGNSERIQEGYIIILHPVEINDGNSPLQWDENYMKDMGGFWTELPKNKYVND